MSRRTTRRPGRQKERRHPSLFFFVVLALGIVFLFWVFAHMVTQPAKTKLGFVSAAHGGLSFRP